MKAIFNSRTINTTDPLLKVTNRAFCYGDGLFETIVTGPGRINLLEKHFQRLEEGAEVLRLIFPNDLSLEKLQNWIEELRVSNKITRDYRIRIHLWRDSGGLYSPVNNSSSFLIEVANTDSAVFGTSTSIGLNEQYLNIYSPISKFKSKDALKYVMLGIDKEQRGLDDIILLDKDLHLSESHTSNVFWTKDQQIFTPSLKTGCVAGIMRNFIINEMNQLGNPVKEVEEDKSVLETCNSIFTTNASGIKWFASYANRKLDSPKSLLLPVIKQLQQL